MYIINNCFVCIGYVCYVQDYEKISFSLFHATSGLLESGSSKWLSSDPEDP